MEMAGFWKKRKKHSRPFETGPKTASWIQVLGNRFYLWMGAAVKAHCKGCRYREGWRIAVVFAVSITMPFLADKIYITVQVKELVQSPIATKRAVLGLRICSAWFQNTSTSTGRTITQLPWAFQVLEGDSSAIEAGFLQDSHPCNILHC